MLLRTPLDDILSSRAKLAVLRVVSTVSAPLSGREIARRGGVWPASAQKALNELVASGVLLCRDYGRTKTYELDHTDVTLVAQLRQLFWTEADRYRQFVADIAGGLAEAMTVVLFGSEARGEAGPESDTDILVVVGEKTEVLEQRVLEVCLAAADRHGLNLAWHLADFADLKDWQTTGNPFWQNVLQDGIVLHGLPLEALEHRWQPGETS